MVITFCFCVSDLDEILETPTGYPFLQVFYNATGTTSGATAMGAFVIAMTTMSQLTTVAAASRQLWAFSRDKAVSFSSWFSRKYTPRFVFLPEVLSQQLFCRNAPGTSSSSQLHFDHSSCHGDFVTYQHRLGCGAQLYRIADDSSSCFQLYVLDWLYDLATGHESAVAAVQIQFGKMGPSHQHRL